ncbi:uncharacterized protein LOC129730449 [Wyeomyia smithii]|uniref:uncharacterized protein LOC129730449 n=1 Tax=Wyeomyia smithii TaxID=174621 RepID=UPI0024681F28|nr:uncharacterized protein LOC129730449 [Wyeomyia smithii]XP_055545756.1 uncharacterized protein LOC129730449 [Wyeomyia smithii]XP_055545757.1 uncharacterized protein LOC129730449 [Wyeomyia smithii]XP_055545758.1 uncharacterized protein LOC129730449 [Wyeomyia smithii]XP_055545759.1 uncharacterized protein LOC129730449 [Wyeomyia smithii]XP_055545760.1 uncharacterized protein LOC129730449 [Wyeomyia smithii]XP_055545761.1 uncharacterized protein LOC129730449 [Wyeomyia smithii]XP_055545762.1 unc
MNGLSTLNRLLGKRNKDVSKSTSNLSRSTTNLDSTSQYNKIVPLAAMTNAPFEQTFRITVLLPRDQLYVARIGAKTRLSTLMDMVCSDKQLDAQKYLFRHPADFHQGFELDLTIGEVGLNEIRLMSRGELENMQTNEYRLSTSDIFRLHQKNLRENSVSSSDLGRTSKVALKTTSPYSSSNSLNSMDSSGLSSSSRGGVNGNQHHAPVAPARKKRIAPRPPSQNSIPEKGPLETVRDDSIFKEPQLPPYSKKNFHVSSPNLYSKELKTTDSFNNNNNNNNNNQSSDYNGNGHHTPESVEEINNIINTKTSYSTLKNRPTSMYIIREPPETINHQPPNGNLQRSSLNGTAGSLVDIVNHSRTSSNSSEVVKDPRDFQEGPKQPPEPRKRLDSNAKKPKAPAPPPRGVSLGTKLTTEPKIVPTPSPRAPVRSTMASDSDTIISETDSNRSEADELQRNKETVNKLNAVNSTHQHRAATAAVQPQNVTKVMLNVDQTADIQPAELSSPSTPKASTTSGASLVSITIVKEEAPPTTANGHHPAPAQYKPAVAPPIVSTVHIVSAATNGEQKAGPEADRRLSNGDNSSEEDIKIYNIESGQELRIPEGKSNRSPSPAEEWTYTLPAPPKFADSSIKSGEYDEKQRYFDLQSTYVENTTVMTDQLTIGSDDTEEIRPIIREKILIDESGLASMETLEEHSLSTMTPNESEDGTGSRILTPGLIPSDIEDSYRDGSELRESMIQTLEKRKEKLKQSELQDLKDSIEGSGVLQPKEQPQECNESDIMKCAKLNEETVVDDFAVVVKRNQVKPTQAVALAETEPIAPKENEELVVVKRKTEVISELSHVIKDENGLKEVLTGGKKIEEEEIPGANRSSLSTFKISTYNNVGEVREVLSPQPAEMYNEKEEQVVIPPTAPKYASDEEGNFVVRRTVSSDSTHRGKLSSDEDESTNRNVGTPLGSNNNKKDPGPVKRRSLTVLNSTPRNINRSDSFHSTRSDYIQSLNSVNGLKLTPRSTSYISLIGAQKFENRFSQPSQRRKSTSEMSICDSPSLQSLEVIKNILNTSRSNLAGETLHSVQEKEILPMSAIKRNSFTDISTLVQYKSEVLRGNGIVRRESMIERKIEQLEEEKQVVEEEEELKPTVKLVPEKKVEIEQPVCPKTIDNDEIVVDVSNESKSDDEKLQTKQLSAAANKPQPQTSVVNITTTSTTVASSGVSVTVNAQSNGISEQKWEYKGPPTINFTTWSERPKIDVSIKSDRDYRFGGSSTLPRGYRNVNNTTKISVNTTPAPSAEKQNGVDCPVPHEQVPLKSGDSALSQEATQIETVSAHSDKERLPIVRAVEYKKNVVPPPVAQKPIDKPFFYETFSRSQSAVMPNGTATINRLTHGHNKFQPVVRGFKSIDEKEPPVASKARPGSMIESTNFSTAILKSTPVRKEKPAQPTAPALPFGQNTLRRTGLKDKILAQAAPEPVKQSPTITPAPVSTPPATDGTVPSVAAAPPPPPVTAKLTTPVVRGAIVKKQLPPPEADPRSALLDAIRCFNREKLRSKDPSAGEEAPSQ